MTTHELLHILWTKVVGTPDYDKKQWMEMEQRLYQEDQFRLKGLEK